jgi:hypothetical protein
MLGNELAVGLGRVRADADDRGVEGRELRLLL